MSADDRSYAADATFFRAILLGAAIGVPIVWIASTLAFHSIATAGWLSAAGFSALPAVFCGPFLGGLFTTSFAMTRVERREREDVTDPVWALEDDLHHDRTKTAA